MRKNDLSIKVIKNAATKAADFTKINKATAKVRMPAEWEKQQAVWIAWPHDYFWPGYSMKLEGTYLRLIELMKTSQSVHIIIPDKQYQLHIERQLEFFKISKDNIFFNIIFTNDIWIRDFGPTFVTKGREIRAIKWGFNGYGERFKYNYDNAAGESVAKQITNKANIDYPPIILEGGNIETNGQGTIMLTESAVLNPSRNPGISRKQIESVLKEYLGATRIIWLSGMVTEDVKKTGWSDDTDSHVDTIARFTAKNTVVAPSTTDKSDPAYQLLKTTHRELKEAGLEIVNLPTIKTGFYSLTNIGEGGGINSGKILRTDASYANFVITNDKIIVPTYGEKEDDEAKEVLREQFPGREIVGVFAGFLAENGGEFHCITQQQPTL